MIMIKHILLVLIVSCSSLVAFEGFYVGGGIGGHLSQGAGRKVQALGTNIIAGTPNEVSTVLQREMFDHGTAGILYAGYGITWKTLYLAAEGFIQLGSAHLQNIQRNVAEQDSEGDQFAILTDATARIQCCQGGLDLLPGWSPNPVTLIYGRIGVGVAKTSLKEDGAFFGTTFNPAVLLPFNLPLRLSKDKTSATLRAGGGLECSITKRFSLRGDYIFTDYGKLSVQGASQNSTEGFILTTSISDGVHLYDHALLLGLCYRFCDQNVTSLVPWRKTCHYSGFYFGGSTGGGALEATQRGQALGSVPGFVDLTVIAEEPPQLTHQQFQGMLFLGYGLAWQRLYLGGELFAVSASHTSMDCLGQVVYITPPPVFSYSSSYKTSIATSTRQYGFDLRPGVLLTPLTLLYGRIGVGSAHIKAHSNAAFQGIDPFADLAWFLPEETSARKRKTTFRLGIGLEHLLTSQLHLRADYIFTNYGIISFNNTARGRSAVGDQPVVFNNTLTSHLKSNAVVVGLSYYFH
jgi:opacity protein-like surface antigen